ncbi:CCR4-NOT transcription complex subunit 9 isoform X1 [Zootermopsis nevadensis]|uniref:CCR4-NOT transcription complex subunit 9 isoform X1 n=1 Tax=Zootermopsis nevadensis TaxID=136037 RepID=UPI000B8E27B3|nr:CCR4-NOT transcription complex subunit 9 isoform X1 [Zootermopsis nevadensis]XP_021927176.1 CCR4-NOT transcription complex subunit 9 isoform X1 [Zootermopsis nevadensis]
MCTPCYNGPVCSLPLKYKVTVRRLSIFIMLFMKYVNPGFHFLRIFSPTGQNIKILHSLNLHLAPRLFMSSQQSPANLQSSVDRDKIYQSILELSCPENMENVLLDLSKKREVVPDLAPMLWHSFGTIAALLQEIVNIYPAINPATLTAHQSNRVCNALALLQCVASHPETRSAFLQAHVPLFLYPFLHTVSKTRPFEYLRLTSLGVIGALVKTDEQEVITFLLTTEIIPLCLRIMESGSELSKTVATFILQKILLDDSGLSYICQTYDRFSHVAMILVGTAWFEIVVTVERIHLI